MRLTMALIRSIVGGESAPPDPRPAGVVDHVADIAAKAPAGFHSLLRLVLLERRAPDASWIRDWLGDTNTTELRAELGAEVARAEAIVEQRSSVAARNRRVVPRLTLEDLETLETYLGPIEGREDLMEVLCRHLAYLRP